MTEIKDSTERFNLVLYALPDHIANVLSRLPIFIKNSACEIRLRANKPVVVTGDTDFYVSKDSCASSFIPENPLCITKRELEEVIKRITDNSLYAREEELKEGYLSMRGGNRAGVCGSFADGKLRSISSVNIRIAREIKGCANSLAEHASGGLLIVGPAGSGKTTLLRDLVRILSENKGRVCVVDTRGEICGRSTDFPLDVGPNTDIITGIGKAEGCEIALRTMNPQYIAFDEVGNGRELSLIKESFFSGVRILATAHASDIRDIKSRRVTKALLDGSIGRIALIKGFGKIKILTPQEVLKYA